MKNAPLRLFRTSSFCSGKLTLTAKLSALIAVTSLVCSQSAQAAPNTTDTFNSGTSLLTPGNWSNGLPNSSSDALFGPSSPAGTTGTPLSITAGSLTVGSLDDTHTGVTTYITNSTSTTTASTLTLGGAGGTNAISGSLPSDLIYVASGASTVLNLYGGSTGALNLVLGQAGAFDVGNLSTLNIGMSGAASTINNGGFALSVSGVGTTNIGSAIAGSGALNKSGTWTLSTTTSLSGGLTNNSVGGTLNLSGVNTYTGATTVNVGTLQLSSLAGGKLSNTSGVTVNGNGTFINGDSTAANNNNVTDRIVNTAGLTLGGTGGAGTFTAAFGATGTTSQTLASLSIGAGGNNINTVNTAAGTLNLAFTGTASGAGYTRSTNGLLNVATATGFNPSFTNAPTAAGGSSVSGTAGSGNEILVGAVLGGNDFVKAAAGNLNAATYTANGASGLTADSNINLTAQNTTLANGTTISINSLRFNDNAARTLNLGSGSALTIASGGILTASAVATSGNTITGGSITSGQGDLWVYTGGANLNNPRNSNNVLNIASKITGAISLTVGGQSSSAAGAQAPQIQLSGTTNDYTGGTFLDNGTIIISQDSNLGAVTGAVTAVSGINTISPTTSFAFNASRNFVVNAGALLHIGDQLNITTTIPGTLSGGGIFETGYVSNAQRVILTGNNSGFTGTYSVNGLLRADEGVGLSSNANLAFAGRNPAGLGILETKGTFTRSLGTGAGQVQWSSPNLGYSDGGFAAFGGTLTVNLGGSAANLTQNSGNFLTGNSILNLQSPASDSTLLWQNPINNNGSTLQVDQGATAASGASTAATMSGVISGSGGFTKVGVSGVGFGTFGAGQLILTGANTYTGKTTIQNGTLSVSSLNRVSGGAASSNLGAPTTVANGLITMGNAGFTATLLYTGTGETTDRTIQIGTNSSTPAVGDTGGAVIQNDGGGALSFSATNFNTASNATTGAGANRLLTLQGSNTGANTISGVIQDNTVSGTGTGTATVGLTKAGSGTWTLTGQNTYTGATIINAGKLVVGVNGAGSLTSAVTVNAGTLGGSGSTTGAVTIGDGNGSQDAFIAPGNSPGTFTTTSTITFASDAVYAFELNSTNGSASSDQIIAKGVTINSAAVFAFSDLGNGSLPSGMQFIAISNTDTTPINGRFSNLPDGATITGNNGETYTASYTGGDGNDLVLTAIPEPSTWGMLVAGLGMLFAGQRLRRRRTS